MDVIEVIQGSSVIEVFESTSTVIEVLQGAKGDPGPSGAGITVNNIAPDGNSNITLTKSAIGLANVDNTSDASKPISTATASALAGKANTSHAHAAADITSGVLAVARLGSGSPSASNYLRGDGAWSAIAKADVGLGNVDNTSDANKPVSSATQTALNLKANLASPTFTGTVSGITAAMVGASATGHTHAAADIASGVIATARLGTGTADSTTYLRGDGTWVAVAGGGGGATALSGLSDVSITSAATGEVLRYNGTAWADYLLTKSDVGLANVDNTADTAKPVSTAQQIALNLKADDSTVAHLAGTETLSGAKTFSALTNFNLGLNVNGANLGIQDSRNIDLGSTNGTRIGTGTGQKLAFFNATPVAQQGNTVELSAVLSNLGLRAGGGAMPFTTAGLVSLGSGGITSSGPGVFTGPVRFGLTTVTANAAPNLTTSNHQYFIDATSNAVTLTLPATTTAGYRILAKRIDSVTANAATVVATLIDGFGTTYTLPAQWDYVELVSTTTSGTWRVVGASRVGAHDASVITSGTLSDTILPTRLQGLSGPTIVDANAATANGYYRMISGADANVPISNFRGVIHVLAYNATYGAQEAYEANTGRNWVRTQTNGVWTAWRENLSESRLPTKTEVGLGNVDNTSDANKPVSTATQTALNLKANTSSPIFSGVLTTVNTTAANDAVVHSLTASLGADATLGSLQVAIGGKPSATAANRYGYIFAADGLAMRPLALNFNGTGYGNVGVGNSAPTERLDVTGNIKASGSVTAATLVGAGSGITTLNAANLASGTVPTARLGSGTASATTYLRGDGTWATPAGGGSSTLATLTDVTITTPVAFQVLQYDGTKWLNGNLDYQLRGTDQNIYYNTGSSTYPVRTSATFDTQRRARWIGPVAPTIGGSYAIADFDIWEKTA